MNKISEIPSFQSEDEISLIDLLVILLRHKMLIFAGTSAAAVGVFLFALGSLVLPLERNYWPNIYTPTAHILLLDKGGGGLSGALASSNLGGLASLAGINVGGGSSSGELAVFLSKSATVLDELSADLDFPSRLGPKVASKSGIRKALLGRLEVSYDSITGIVKISYSDTDPVYAHRVVNRLVEILGLRFAALEGNKAKSQKAHLEEKLADVQIEMSRLEGEVKAFQAKHGILSVEALAKEQIEVLARMRSALILKDMEIENYEKFSKIEDPEISRLRSERESIRSKIVELESGASVLPSQKDIPAISFTHAGLQRDLLVQTEILKILTQQYELAKLASTDQDAVFQVLELAEIPDEKTGPSRGKVCILVTLGAFFVFIFASFVLEAVKNIMKDPDAVAKLHRGAA